MTNKSEDFSFDAETNFGFPSFFKKGKDGDDISEVSDISEFSDENETIEDMDTPSYLRKGSNQ